VRVLEKAAEQTGDEQEPEKAAEQTGDGQELEKAAEQIGDPLPRASVTLVHHIQVNLHIHPDPLILCRSRLPLGFPELSASASFTLFNILSCSALLCSVPIPFPFTSLSLSLYSSSISDALCSLVDGRSDVPIVVGAIREVEMSDLNVGYLPDIRTGSLRVISCLLLQCVCHFNFHRAFMEAPQDT